MVLDTYRYLRGGMVVMIVLLGAAVLIERWHASCWQTTISAYYFTSAHAVFIAALCVIGALLIVYKGNSDTEDALLNFAGILAFVVAMVPTSRPVLLCGSAALDVDGRSAIVNTWAVVVALAVSRAASWWLHQRNATTPTRSTLGTAAVWVQRVALTAGVVVLAVAPDWFRANAHGVAAVAMFGAIILTVAIAAFTAGNTRYRRIYQVIAASMAVTLLGAVVLHYLLDGFNHAIIVVEAALIGEFAIYWLVQTVELWGTVTRLGRLAPDALSNSRILRAL